MNIKKYLLALGVVIIGLGLFFLNYSNSAAEESVTTVKINDVVNTAQASQGNHRSLIVFFTRTKGVYAVGEVPIGHTHRIANYIQEATGADMYEIVPEKEYPNEYRATTEVARAERDNNERPAIKGSIPDVSQYDTIYIGSPIWWGEYPMVVRTFLDQVDLNGKTVTPYTTHEGSGLGSTTAILARQFPQANILEGLAIRGSNADSDAAKTAVQTWLQRIGVLGQ